MEIKKLEFHDTISLVYTEETIETYWKNSGDRNPIHFRKKEWFEDSPLFVKKTGINRRIVPGFLYLGTIIAKVENIFWQGAFTPIFLREFEVKFFRPVFYGEEVQCAFACSSSDGGTLYRVRTLLSRNGEDLCQIDARFLHLEDDTYCQNPVQYSHKIAGMVWSLLGDGALLYHLKGNIVCEVGFHKDVRIQLVNRGYPIPKNDKGTGEIKGYVHPMVFRGTVNDRLVAEYEVKGFRVSEKGQGVSTIHE